MFESFVGGGGGGGGFGLHHVENFFMESLSQLFYLFHECHFTLSLKVYLLQESSSTTTFLSLILLLAAFFKVQLHGIFTALFFTSLYILQK